MTPVAALVLAACLPANPRSDHITAGDLAVVVPGLASVAPDTPVALAPAPGVRRILHRADLERIASKLQTTISSPAEICLERRVAPLDGSAIQATMQRAAPDARINLLDFSRAPVPEGELVFPISGLTQTQSGGWWNGLVRYGNNHRFVVWAKVKVVVTATRVIANEALRPGQPVSAEQLRLESKEEVLMPAKSAATVEEIIGRMPRRRIPPGAAVDRTWFEAPKEVSRGDRLRVDVWSGGAHLEMEGKAEASGAVGQTIPVLNPGSNKRFPARIEGPGRASVRSDVR